MKLSSKIALVAAPLMVALAAPVSAQIFQAAGFATVNVAGLGNTTTVAGESRIPILPRDVEYNSATGVLHIRATGHRGAVRELNIDVHGPSSGNRVDVSATGSSLRVRMETGPELVADTGHGNVTITVMDERHVTGTYDGTFTNGPVPVLVRGRFEATFPRAHASGASSSPSP